MLNNQIAVQVRSQDHKHISVILKKVRTTRRQTIESVSVNSNTNIKHKINT